MLPRKHEIGVTLGLLIVCFSGLSSFVAANEFDSNAWHNGPINCYHCNGAADCAPSNTFGLVKKCQGNDAQSCVVVFDDSGVVVERGCSDIVYGTQKDYCVSHPESCRTCKSSGCNDATALNEFTSCLSCDSALDENCQNDPSAITTHITCHGGCMTALYPTSNASTPNHLLVRSCLSDLDLDDREACLNGVDPHCIACKVANCNVQRLPAERHSCYHCKGDDCEDVEVQECADYKEGEKRCYIMFEEETAEVIEMGCAESLKSKESIETLIRKKLLLMCIGENCNTFTSIPHENECFKCSSNSSEACVTSAISTTSKCRGLPYTHCYERVNMAEGGTTERGCLSELDEDSFYNCLTGKDDKCRACTGDGCNKAIIPANRQQCHRCDSTYDENCSSAPNSAQACPLYKAEDHCVSKLIAGVTHRGCSSELNCEGLDAKQCQTCTGNNCNTVNLNSEGGEGGVEESIGHPGLFQDLPLNCYHCDGEEACNDIGTVHKCEGNDLQTCTVVFGSNGKVVKRGCSDLVNATCKAADNTCHGCKSNGCNVAEKQSDLIECVFCDAQEHANCVLDATSVQQKRLCHQSCMTALYPRSNDANPVYELVRTCLDDMDIDDQENCQNGNNPHCKTCRTANCNAQQTVGERKSCYQCTGDDCQAPKSQSCRGVLEDDQCFALFDETRELIELGCKSKYDASEAKALINAKRLWLCDEDDCNYIDNLPLSQTCTICSSRTDPNCAIAPEKVNSNTSCAITPYTQCYSRIIENGYTERGCLSSLEGDNFYNCLTGGNATHCFACNGDACNAKLYPSDRRSCSICSSDKTPECEASPAFEQVCLKYSETEHCISTLTNDGITVRGCSSNVNCSTTDATHCQVCDENNCNTSNLKRKSDGKPGRWQTLPLSCKSCSTQAECLSGGSSEQCSGHEYCMTVFDESGAVVRRGCSAAVERDFGAYCDKNSANCHNCNSNICNSAANLSDYIDCIYCDSETNPKCATNPTAIGNRRKCHKQCVTALYARNSSNVFELTRSCLDDLEAKEQLECLEGSEHCSACSTNACNTKVLPENRLSCNFCTSEGDCEDIESRLCTVQKENDKCYMLFNNQSDPVQFGCVSDLDDSFLQDNIHMMYICNDGDNCNGFENIPQAHQCAECDSNADSRCAVEPINTRTETCATFPNTQCYVRVLSDGSTSRGCLGRLPKSEMLGCLSGNSTNCASCLGDRCNTQIYPADRRQCHRCNSKEDPFCESTPESPSVCPIYSADEFCTVKFVNEETYRDCSSEFQCDESDKQACRHCNNTNNCNTVDLAALNIGYPGKWQAPPISCYTCKGAECQNGNQEPLRKCENNLLQNCGTVFNKDGLVVQRGCSDIIYADEYAEHCDENPNLCKFCKSNSCNTAKALTDFIDCVYCDGVNNRDCVSNVEKVSRKRSCHKKCLSALYARTNEDNPAYELTRGCLDDLEPADEISCENGTLAHCVACQGTACNTVNVPEKRHSCYICEDGDCRGSQSRECSAYRETDECFTLFDSRNQIERKGCLSDLDWYDVIEKRRQMIRCTQENCNSPNLTPEPTSCSSCNSTLDPNCAINPTEAQTAVDCNIFPNTECITHVDNAGVTHRGCLSNVLDDVYDACLAGSKNCAICNTERCNTQIFPVNRRRCHRCNSGTEPSCEDKPNFPSICPIYHEDDTCVSKLDNSLTVRGCSSELNCDKNNSATCRVCGTDNCNTVDLISGYIGEPGRWQALPLNCFKCEGAECLDGSNFYAKCEGNLLQNCMTVFNAEGVVQARGCSDALKDVREGYCDEHPDRCFACKSNACNNATALNDFVDCYFCDSETSETCSVNFSNSTRTRKCQGKCMVALYPRSSSNDTAYELSRSCLNDKDPDDQKECANGENEYCRACEGERCNTFSILEDRHECYQCADAECEDPISEKCNTHLPGDQCYTLYINDGTVARMGCRSEFETAVVTELVKNKQLLLCDGKNCNSPEKLPTAKICTVCHSSSDTRCATNPNLVQNTERCPVLPYTDCFTRVDEKGQTSRGCLSSLPNDIFYNCLTNVDGLCTTCTGDNCNEIDIFPANRMRCHQCNSAIDPSCAAAPNSNNVCLIYVENDGCISSLSNGVTIRGCASDTQCKDESDQRNCRKCSTPGCNTVNLELVPEEGEPGKWQDVPLTCSTCKNEEDCVYKPCENNPYQSCMTVFNEQGAVTQRGCSDTVQADNQAYCDTNPGKCLRCNSNGCNEAVKSLDEYVACLNCDSNENADCVRNVSSITKTRLCYKHCMTTLYPHFKEENPSYHLERTCYDDMDIDDRDACVAGKKENCRTCNTAKCNTVEIVENRLSCNACSDDDCQDPKAESCVTHRFGDNRCYIEYDEQRSVVRMGCRSHYSNEHADYLLRLKRLFLCSGDNCNTIEAQPPAQSCVLCSSRTDVNCAIKPQDVKSKTTCALIPFTQCYSRVLENGATERGCLSSLENDNFQGCLNGTSATCHACEGNDCNNKIFPSNRTSCHICDSTDPKCEVSPDSIGVCPKYDPNETCVTSYKDGITSRGCSSSLLCDSTDSKSCVKCTGNGCNTVNLAKKQDDNFGKWQDLPLRCLNCKGDECKSEATVKKLTCENDNEQDCVSVFDDNGVVVRRGCTNEVYAEYSTYCRANETNCFSCKSNECNTATARSQFIDCIYCDSHEDPTCIWNAGSDEHSTRKCQGQCMTALYPSDGSTDPAYDLIRTCLNDKEAVNQTQCAAGTDISCKACSNGKCNNDNVPENRQRCFICDGEDCEDTKSLLCPLFKNNDQCFTWFDEANSISQMGCVSSFRNQDLEAIIKTKRVHICDGVDCNSPDNIPTPQQCAVCDSKNDTLCAVNAEEIGEFDTCDQLPYTDCYSRLLSDGSTVRGCLQHLPANEFAACVLGKDKNCGICLGDGCNRGIFPPDRLLCHTCTSEDDSQCESFPSKAQPCPLVNEAVTCKTALSVNVTLRGCSSDILCDTNDSRTCRSCNATRCNAIDLYHKVDDGYHGVWQSLPLKCHTCANEHCLSSLGSAENCTRNPEQDCMTVFNATGSVIRRGCEDDVEDYGDLHCRQQPHLCFKCKSNECNVAWNTTEYIDCAFCRGSNQSTCITEPNSVAFGRRSCYKECMVAMLEDDLIRSCLDDKELLVQSVCRTNENGIECQSCEDSGCNNFVFPADRLKCHVCSGSGCSSSEAKYCLKYDRNDFCFAKFERGAVDLMGCGSSVSSNEIEDWTAQKKLYRCEGNDCNDLSKIPSSKSCVACDSSKTPDCAQNPAAVTYTDDCWAPNSECYTRTDSDGRTLRGCFINLNGTEQDSCQAGKDCDICSGDKCNNKIYPAGRRSCVTCKSVSDSNCIKNPPAPQICQVYNANTDCVTKKTGDLIERGCSTDLTCNAEDQLNCQICTTDGCNIADLSPGAAGTINSSIMLTITLAFVVLFGFNRH